MSNTKEKVKTLDEILSECGISKNTESEFRLVLWNDDFNSFEWVIICLIGILSFTPEEAEKSAWLSGCGTLDETLSTTTALKLSKSTRVFKLELSIKRTPPVDVRVPVTAPIAKLKIGSSPVFFKFIVNL